MKFYKEYKFCGKCNKKFIVMHKLRKYCDKCKYIKTTTIEEITTKKPSRTS